MLQEFGGATGNFNAHHVSFEVDWKNFGQVFIEDQLGFTILFQPLKSNHYDSFAALLDAMRRINIILIDFRRPLDIYLNGILQT